MPATGTRGPSWPRGRSRRRPRAGDRGPDAPGWLVLLVAEVSARDALLQVLERPEVLDDVAAGVVEEDLAVLVPADRHQPLEVIAILEQIVDEIGRASCRE